MLLDPWQSRIVFQTALARRFALLAVNADSPAALTDVLEAALGCDAPVIIETSLWQLTGRSFGAGDAALGLARYLVQIALLSNAPRFASIPVILHTDHIQGPLTLPLLRAAIAGLDTGIADPRGDRQYCKLSPSTISLDSSRLAEAGNIAAIVELAQWAEQIARPVTLEMEAGVDAGVTAIDVAERLLGAVEQSTPGAVHLWAPGVGTQHGLGSQSTFSADAVALHQQCATRVLGRPVGIALHGSSGLPPGELRAAVAAGAVKVNWSSESLLIRSTAAREFFSTHSLQLEKSHPDWKKTAMDNGLQTFVSEHYVPRVKELITILGGAGAGALCRAAL